MRYRNNVKRRYFRGDAAFANPEIYGFLEAEGYKYTIRLPANAVLQERIGWLLTRPRGRPPHDVRRFYANRLSSPTITNCRQPNRKVPRSPPMQAVPR
jgi:hypothetical protein